MDNHAFGGSLGTADYQVARTLEARRRTAETATRQNPNSSRNTHIQIQTNLCRVRQQRGHVGVEEPQIVPTCQEEGVLSEHAKTGGGKGKGNLNYGAGCKTSRG